MGVKREYEALLKNKLNQLWHQGHVIFERWELLAWYERDRITNVVWRDINDAWGAMFAGEPQALSVVRCDESTSPQKFVVVNTAMMTTIEVMAAEKG